ncbi:5'-AMP-activated protein kinase subunit gamma [Schistosoma japonicum]|nr:5'-AMP-activated protein kinase subunit gamma [Schistosoma japonicum]
MLEAEKYNQSSLVADLIDSEDGASKSFNTKDSAGYLSSVSPDELSPRSVPTESFPATTITALEPIPQGEELSTDSLIASMVHIHTPISNSINMNRQSDDFKFTVQNCHSPSNNHITQLKMEVCCPCRSINSDLQQKYCSHDTGQICSKTSVKTNVTGTTTKQINSSNHPLNQGNNTNSNRDSVTSRSSWARSIFERLRASSLSSSIVDSKSHHSTGHNESSLRSKEYNSSHFYGTNISPDVIDPRRLPKAHGPVSNCLEFSKRPLQKFNIHLHSKSIPASSTHSDLMSSSLSNSLQSSSNNKPRKRIRWFSHSTSCDAGPGDPLLGASHYHPQLNSSVVEEIQGAVNILAGRQVFPSNVAYSRPGIRVKSASESEHLLVISKSMSNSKEELSPSSLGHFDENHVYTTLFRHSTCYDVLPDSGKLVILDSRLPTLRAICALLDNGVMAAPVWCNETQSYMGVFSQELALDMLGHLHYTEVIKNINSDCQTSSSFTDVTGDESTTTNNSSSSTQFFSSFNANLYGWGSKQLGEVFNYMYNRLDRQLSDLFVFPHYCLQKALCRLFHHTEQHRSCNNHHDALLKFSYSSTVDHRCLYPNNPTKTDIDGDPTDKLFTRQSSVILSTETSNHSSPRLSVTEENASVVASPFSPPIDSYSLNSLTNYQMSSTYTKLDYSMLGAVSSDFERVSPKCCFLSNPASLYASLVSYLIVIDKHSGNALGLLCLDRLLAYLRLRVDELPNKGRMNVPIGSVQGLRWTERCTSKKPTDVKINSTSPLLPKQNNPEYLFLQFKEIPVLHPNDRIRDALHMLTSWLPQLPCLPVMHFIDDNQSHSIGHIGFISPGDLLNFIICSTSDNTLNEPVSKIVEKKAVHCPNQHQCVCYITESVATVLDRMFRLKAPCLIMFDVRRNSASSTVSSKQLGRPVGVVTAKDILHTVILGHRHRHSSMHSNSTNRIDGDENANQKISSDQYILCQNKIRGINYKRTVSFESGVVSSSCQDGSESIYGASSGQVQSKHFEEKPSRSESICSFSSGGTFSVSSSTSEAMRSLSNENVTSTCVDTVTKRGDCNCSCHRQPFITFDGSIHHQQQQVHDSKDTRDSLNTSVGFLDRKHSRLLPHGSGGWNADRRFSVPHTVKEKMRNSDISENNRKFTGLVGSNKIKHPIIPNSNVHSSNDLNNSLQLINNSLDAIDELIVGDASSKSDITNGKNKLEPPSTRDEDDTVFPMD